jgi:putative ABC transport system permease protein
MLTESVMLATIGGGLGLLIAYAAVRGVVAYGPTSIPRLSEIQIDRVALGFTMLVTTVTGIVFGLVPARQSRVRNLTSSLRGSARQGGGYEGAKLRHTLVIAELALSLALLVGATLLVRSFLNLNRVSLGFQAGRRRRCRWCCGSVYAKPDQQRAFNDRLLERVRAVPGVRVAGAAQRGLLDLALWTSDFTVEHRAPDDFGIGVRHNEVTPGYVEAIGARIVRGRDFNDGDRPGSPPVVLVNDALVRRYFKNEDPIGQHLNFERPGGKSPWRTIVGVVHDFREEAVDVEPGPTIYEPLAVNTDLMFTMVVRSAIDAEALAPALRSLVRQLDPDIPLPAVRPLDAKVGEALAPQRFVTTLMVLFALAGVALATVGLYGVLSYLAAQRTHEIGVRVALGANVGDVVRLVARQAFVLIGVGVAAGLVLALMAGRLMSGLLFGVNAHDGASYAVVVMILFVVASLAVLVPVRRALRVSPLVALRAE